MWREPAGIVNSIKGFVPFAELLVSFINHLLLLSLLAFPNHSYKSIDFEALTAVRVKLAWREPDIINPIKCFVPHIMLGQYSHLLITYYYCIFLALI